MNSMPPPAAMTPLIAMGASDRSSPAEFRSALQTQDREQLARNAFHLIEALRSNSDLAVTAMKFACVHETLSSGAGVIWAPMSSTLLGCDDQHQRLTDEQACRFVRFVLDELDVKPFPGLIYMACRFGWLHCARLLKDRGVYAPLDWKGFATDSDEDRVQLVSALLEIVDPPPEDRRVIRRAFKDGEPAAVLLDRSLQ